jgi:hypothetical protein
LLWTSHLFTRQLHCLWMLLFYLTAPEGLSPELLSSEEDDWPQRLKTRLRSVLPPSPYREPSVASRLALYVDGSARGPSAAWTVVAVEYDWCGLPTLLGALSGLVETVDWGPPARQCRSRAHSLCRRSSMVALALPHTGFTVIRPDLTLSALLSTSTWSCSAHSSLVAVARWLGLWFGQSGGLCLEVRGPWSYSVSLERPCRCNGASCAYTWSSRTS